jgi:hypothetical protein
VHADLEDEDPSADKDAATVDLKASGSRRPRIDRQADDDERRTLRLPEERR